MAAGADATSQPLRRLQRPGKPDKKTNMSTEHTDETPMMRAQSALLDIERDNARLAAIAAESLANSARLLAESADDIQSAINLAVQESDDETGKTPVVRLAHSLAIHIDKDGIVDALTVSLRHKREAVSRLPDPNQPGIPGIS